MTNNIAAVILAAGGSSRMGKPKQLLIWQGKELINHAIDLAIESGLNPVIVVLGAYYSRIIKKVDKKNAIVIERNLSWKKGQSTSLKLGLAKIRDLNIPAILLLIDQPGVNKGMIHAIIDLYKKDSSDAIMTETKGKRTPPVLLSPKCYRFIDDIEGDIGAREILKKVKVQPYNNQDVNAVEDIDTLDNYDLLIARSHIRH
jgi:molybdenum cofactor cytidylyltransferase